MVCRPDGERARGQRRSTAHTLIPTMTIDASFTNLLNWIHDNITYPHGTRNSSTSAPDTTITRRGVCRDLAHLGIALCRAINVPARIVAGFVHSLNLMDLHAWFEDYIGRRWFSFDATEDNPGSNRIVIAYDRDAVDVAQASLFAHFTCTTMLVTTPSPKTSRKNKPSPTVSASTPRRASCRLPTHDPARVRTA